MRSALKSLAPGLVGAALGAALAALLPGCGGGGGGSNSPGSAAGATINLIGTPGRLSQTPQEANAGNGTTPPASFDSTVTTENQWFRIEYPFDVVASSLLENDPALEPFSFLNGNITITDVTGAHVPGIAVVNGIDAQGNNLSLQIPHDIDTAGVDHNLGPNVFLFVADADDNLATKAPFGGYAPDPLNPNDVIETTTSSIDTVRVNVSSTNGVGIDATWAFHIGTGIDVRPPYIVSVTSEVRDPTDPLNPASIDAGSALIVRFSEPVVPQSVGHSASLNGFPFDGNLPNPVIGPQLPDTGVMATVNPGLGRLFIPYDCEPLNVNNLAAYRLQPLVSLPSLSSVDGVVRAVSMNQGVATIDLSGNFYDGQDVDGDGQPDGVTYTSTFAVGPGPAIVNIPVSPEVVYWAPNSGNGIGAIDLNGNGFTTNTPGANVGDASKAKIITKFGDMNFASGIATIGHPGELGLPYNRYRYPVGTGDFIYGAGQPDWVGPAGDPGNPGTPLPGVNEGSSGFETLCRDNAGGVILTGAQSGTVGNVQDLIVGEFLDRIYHDHFNIFTADWLHISFYNGFANTQGRNVISDPPIPNPPPTRYWVGLPPVDVVLDGSVSPPTALLIEGDEVFTGPRPAGPLPPTIATSAGANTAFVSIQPNPVNPNAADQTLFPHLITGPLGFTIFGNGPGVQSATSVFTFSARQQVGNFLYATDATSREVQAINSNTMRVITSIPLPDPTGLAMSPDMEYLFVTNLSDDSMSVVVADPTSANFHHEIARMKTGSGPRAIAVQGENEDIFVCNYAGNTVSIIDPRSLTIRKTLDSLINGPFDVEVSERQQQPSAPHPFGWACGLYFAYVSNLVGNSVIVYESGPDGAQGIGINNIRGSLPTDDSNEQLLEPRGLCFSPFANPLGLFAGGVFIAHRDELGFGRVSHIQFTQQAIFGPLPIQPPPGFFIPPGFTDRVFEVTGSWGGTDASRLAGTRPSDVTLCDLNTASYHSNPGGSPNGGGPTEPPSPEQSGYINSKNHNRLGSGNQSLVWVPDRLYVAFDDSDVIQVLDPAQAGVIVNSIEGHQQGGTKKLMSFWRQ